MSKILLKKLQLENFKCYQKATINFKELSIIVGENNAGKSCLIGDTASYYAFADD